MLCFVRPIAALVVVFGALLVLAGCGGHDDTRPAGLPADFPLAQVPLVDGTVLTADGSRSKGWSVTVQAPAATGNAVDAAVSKLTKAGYAESQRDETGALKVVILSSDKSGTTYWVQVGSTPGAAGGGSSVFYQVSIG